MTKTKKKKQKRRAPALRCPWCGEPADVFVDVGAGAHQSYVEDCAVCCRPCVIGVTPDEEGEPMVSIARE